MSRLGAIERWTPLVQSVRDLGSDMMDRTDDELRSMRNSLSRNPAGEAIQERAIAQAFAVVQEAARRTTGYSYSDTDIIAGAILASGQAAEAQDSGYDCYIAMLPMYFHAVRNYTVHYVTTTAATASRRFRSMEGFCAALGLRAELLPGESVSPERLEVAPDIDVVYGCYRKMIFEYLGGYLTPDSVKTTKDKPRMAVVDQIDSILIDQANLPLVIRAPKPPNEYLYRSAAAAASELKRGADYEIDARSGKVSLTGDGLARAAALLRAASLDEMQAAVLRSYLEDALRAKDWYRRGADYQLAGAEIVFTADNAGGRAPRLREGIIQSIEAKEGVAISEEEVIWARITVREYFRSYTRLCGLSGVVAHSGQELMRMYGLRAEVVPTGQPARRIDHPDLIFDSAQARSEALVNNALERRRAHQPVVIGAATAQDGIDLGQMLEDHNGTYSAVLFGDEADAQAVMARVWHPGSITILRALAARGIDIVPEPGLTSSAGQSESSVGLAVLGAGRSRSWRADAWLRGLTGRRGAPGESRFFLSSEDALLRGLQSRIWASLPARFRERADGAPVGAALRHVIDGIQRKAEEADFGRRLEQFAFDDVEGAQREKIYSLREELLHGTNRAACLSKVVDEVAAFYVRRYTDPDRLLSTLGELYPTRLGIADLIGGVGDGERGDYWKEGQVRGDMHNAYQRHEQFLGFAAMRETERRIISTVINRYWSRHLSDLDSMRMLANSSPDPGSKLPEYRNEAARRYTAMFERIKEDIVGYIFHSLPDDKDADSPDHSR